MLNERLMNNAEAPAHRNAEVENRRAADDRIPTVDLGLNSDLGKTVKDCGFNESGTGSTLSFMKERNDGRGCTIAYLHNYVESEYWVRDKDPWKNPVFHNDIMKNVQPNQGETEKAARERRFAAIDILKRGAQEAYNLENEYRSGTDQHERSPRNAGSSSSSAADGTNTGTPAAPHYGDLEYNIAVHRVRDTDASIMPKRADDQPGKSTVLNVKTKSEIGDYRDLSTSVMNTVAEERTIGPATGKPIDARAKAARDKKLKTDPEAHIEKLGTHAVDTRIAGFDRLGAAQGNYQKTVEAFREEHELEIEEDPRRGRALISACEQYRSGACANYSKYIQTDPTLTPPDAMALQLENDLRGETAGIAFGELKAAYNKEMKAIEKTDRERVRDRGTDRERERDRGIKGSETETGGKGHYTEKEKEEHKKKILKDKNRKCKFGKSCKNKDLPDDDPKKCHNKHI